MISYMLFLNNRGADMKITSQRGVALLVALSVAIILVILATAMMMLVRGHYGTTANQIKHAKAYYLAEAGVQYAIARLRVGDWTYAGIHNIKVENPNDVQITIEVNGNGYNIHSRAVY